MRIKINVEFALQISRVAVALAVLGGLCAGGCVRKPSAQLPEDIVAGLPQLLNEWPVAAAKVPSGAELYCVAGTGAKATWTADPAAVLAQGKGALRIDVAHPGRSGGDIQAYFKTQQALGTSGEYAVSFLVRASLPVSFTAFVRLHDAPWSALSKACAKTVDADAGWRNVTLLFSPDKDVAEGLLIRTPCLFLGTLPAGVTVWIAQVTLSEIAAPVPPLRIVRSEELLLNPGFESGTEGWRGQAAEAVAVSGAAHAGEKACQIRKRTARWGSPLQDIRGALAANGQGFYDFGAFVRREQGKGEAFAVLHLKDGDAERWICSDVRKIDDRRYVRLAAEKYIGWSGVLKVADISIQTTGDDTAGLQADDFSLRAIKNLARGRAYAASGETAGHPARLAFDGDFTTRWQGDAAKGNWLAVDFGQTVTFNCCVLGESGKAVRSFEIQCWDGAWHTVFTGTSIRTPTDEIYFDPVSGSQARLAFTDGKGLPAINEFAVYTYGGVAPERTVRIPLPPADPQQRGTKTFVGAIRWDGWCGDQNPVGLDLERVFGPEKYHFRLPFYAAVRGPGHVEIRCTSQAVMDREIAFAKEAGIDYWAFDWYPPGVGLATARKLYLASAHRDDVKWCVILGTGAFGDSDLKWLTDQFKQANYQKVLGNRPLVYVFDAGKKFAEQVKSLRAEAARAGVATPFVVFMGWSAAIADAADVCGADALSAYVNPVGKRNAFAANMAYERNQWQLLRETDKQVVPTVTTGWDTRPFFDSPAPWYAGATEGNWVETAKPEEVASQLREGLEFVKKCPDATLANTVLIYAWNENAEGGWIIPTASELQTSGYPLRLDAIRSLLKPESVKGSGWADVGR